MSKTNVFRVVIALLVLTLISADNVLSRVGEQLYFPQGEGEMQFTAGTPFHIAHGWRAKIPGSTRYLAQGGLRLLIDGKKVDEDFVEHVKRTEIEEGEEITYLYKYYVFNFPEGMEGTHTFVFYYSNVCSVMQELDLVETCAFPNRVVECTYPYKSWVVTFEDP